MDGGRLAQLVRQNRSGLSLVAVAVSALSLAAPPPAAGAPGGSPRVELAAPGTVRPEETASVRVHPEQAEVCELGLTAKRSPASSSRVELGEADTISWRWRVPTTAGSATWTGTVRCWATVSDAGVEAPGAEEKFRVEVQGHTGRSPALVEPGTLAVALSRDPSTWGSPADIAQVASAVIALLTIAVTLEVARRSARGTRTTQFMERYNNRDFLANWSNVLLFINMEGKDETECVDRIRRYETAPTGNDPLLPTELDPGTDSSPSPSEPNGAPQGGDVRDEHGPRPPTLNDVLAALHFHEEAAMLFNNRRIDRRLITRLFGPPVVGNFNPELVVDRLQAQRCDGPRQLAARSARTMVPERLHSRVGAHGSQGVQPAA